MQTPTLKTMLKMQLHTLVLMKLTVIFKLNITASKLSTWFDNNHMKSNPEKSHLLLSSKTPKKAYFGAALVESSPTEKYLEFRLILTFDEHISSVCNKVGKKNNVFNCFVNYMSFDKSFNLDMNIEH